jgi:Zn-dependent protease with chaperone function
MYNHFITFIVVLFICATYRPRATHSLSPPESLILFALMLAFFMLINRFVFARITKRTDTTSFAERDHRFENTIFRQTLLAILLFIMALYLLAIPDMLFRMSLFTLIPTLLTVMCLCIFLTFVTLIYKDAHGVYQKLYHHRIPRGTYILSNLSFAVPILLPWLVLSFSSDMLRLLPLGPINTFLESPTGEVFFFIVFIFFIAAVGPLFIQKMWRCRPMEAGYRRDRISRLCESASMGYKDIVYWTLFGGKMVTAGVMGLIRPFRYILVTPALLQMLDDKELDAVVAHEIGHVKKYHMLFYMIILIGYLVLSYFFLHVVSFILIFSQMTTDTVNIPATDSAGAMPLLFISIFIISFVLYFRFIFGFFMRNFERQADTYVYRLFDSAKGLISSLEKIALVSGIPKEKPNWHHFSIKERIGFLNRCEKNRLWIYRHDKKVRNGIMIYMIALVLLGLAEFGLNFTETGSMFTNAVFQKAIISEIDKSPENQVLYGLLGDSYQFDGDWPNAVIAYEKALILDPEYPNVLNNLAWLLATCKDRQIKNPEKALVLAKKAASLDNSPHILDTLAESYYACGRADKAVEIIEMIIDTVEGDKQYYLGQLEKFEAWTR